jgi:hypothetical protein
MPIMTKVVMTGRLMNNVVKFIDYSIGKSPQQQQLLNDSTATTKQQRPNSNDQTATTKQQRPQWQRSTKNN